MLALRASGENRGTLSRKSVASNFVCSSIFPSRSRAKRTERDEADAKLIKGWEQFGLGPAPEQRVLALTAVMGSIVCARRIVCTPASERP